MSNLLVDRDNERRELGALVESGRPGLALLTGRWRVGKTYLLTHVWPPGALFLFTAARTTPELNRQQLLHDLSGWLAASADAAGPSGRPEDYPTW